MTFSIGEKEYELSQNGITWLNPLSDGPSETAPVVQDTTTTMRNLKRFYPDGLIPLVLEEIHASEIVEPYAVLPSHAGLLQLMAEGSVVFDEGFFIIRREFDRFPGGMFGGFSARFVLEPGVPMPEGTPGHSPVVSGETGECLTPLISCRG